MKRDQFVELPAAVALGLVWDYLDLERLLSAAEAPRPARAPKYDQRIYRKDGVQYASEMRRDSLIWWRDRYLSNASDGGPYAEKDSKNAERLGYWIDWRAAEPDAAWSGVRDDAEIVAAAPSHKAPIYPKGERPEKHTARPWPAEDFGGESSDGGDLPF